MSRIRTIKPAFFKHEELFDLEQKTGLPLRVAFAALWTVCDREGRFQWRPRALKLDCLPYDDVDFSRVLDALATRGFVVKYESDGKFYGFVPSFSVHQVINPRESASVLPNPHKNNVIDASLTRETSAETRHIPAHGEGKGKGTLPPLTPQRGDVTSDLLSEVETKPTPKARGSPEPKSYRADFLEFWRGYPTDANMSKSIAFRRWEKLSAGDKSSAIASLPAYRAYCGKHADYRPKHAAGYLSERRFEGHLIEVGKGGNGQTDSRFRVKVNIDTPQWDAWGVYYLKTTGRSPPNPKNEGWWFPSEWPPGSAEKAVQP